MSVYARKDNGNWFIDFSDRFGRVRRTLDREKYSKRQAEALERLLRQEREQGGPKESRSRAPRWSELAARYWLEHGQHLSWAVTVRGHLNELSNEIGDATPVDQITPDLLAGIFGKWRGRKISDTTLNRRMAVMRGAWLRAADLWQWNLRTIPWKRLTLAEPEPVERNLSLNEVRRLIDNSAPHLAFAIEFAFLTGLRPGAILSLTWEAVDTDRKEINAIGKGRAGGKPNVIVITPALDELLDRIGRKDVGSIITFRGKAVGDIRTAWRKARSRAGMPGIRFHDLRHTFAQDLLDDVGDLSMVKDALHYTNAKTTQRYAHRSQKQLREALTRVQAARRLR